MDIRWKINIFDKIHDVDLKKTMEDILYRLCHECYCITEHLPDVRDGLKPVQRRILVLNDRIK